jgi:hypothetical protein
MTANNRRIFSRSNPNTGAIQWFFKSSEGPMGPYETEEEANIMLGAFIDTWKREGRIDDAFVRSAMPVFKLGSLRGEMGLPAL